MEKLFLKWRCPCCRSSSGWKARDPDLPAAPQGLWGETAEKIGLLEKKIYTLAGEEFNISSPSSWG